MEGFGKDNESSNLEKEPKLSNNSSISQENNQDDNHINGGSNGKHARNPSHEIKFRYDSCDEDSQDGFNIYDRPEIKGDSYLEDVWKDDEVEKLSQKLKKREKKLTPLEEQALYKKPFVIVKTAERIKSEKEAEKERKKKDKENEKKKRQFFEQLKKRTQEEENQKRK